MYMLSYENLGEETGFGRPLARSGMEKLSSRPELKDVEIVANISNVILAPLDFSPIH